MEDYVNLTGQRKSYFDKRYKQLQGINQQHQELSKYEKDLLYNV